MARLGERRGDEAHADLQAYVSCHHSEDIRFVREIDRCMNMYSSAKPSAGAERVQRAVFRAQRRAREQEEDMVLGYLSKKVVAQ